MFPHFDQISTRSSLYSMGEIRIQARWMLEWSGRKGALGAKPGRRGGKKKKKKKKKLMIPGAISMQNGTIPSERT